MTAEEIDKLIRSGDLIITTKKVLAEAVVQSIEHLYKVDGEFYKNHYINNREFDQLSKQDCTDISDDIIEYITDQ